MTRIEKNISFYKKNMYLLMAGFWVVIAIIMFFLSEEGKYIAPGLYLIGGILYGYLAYKAYKTGVSEFLSWNNEELVVAQVFSKPQTYPFDEYHQITVSDKHLIVKAPKAKGIMLDLKGFAEEDIKKLRSRFSAGSVLAHS